MLKESMKITYYNSLHLLSHLQLSVSSSCIHLFLSFLLTFFLSFFLSFVLSFVLSFFLPFFLSFFLSFLLSFLLSFFFSLLSFLNYNQALFLTLSFHFISLQTSILGEAFQRYQNSALRLTVILQEVIIIDFNA